jgi:hypothetical protein
MKRLSFLAVGPQKTKGLRVTSGAASYIFGEIEYTFMLDIPSALFGREQCSTVVITTTAHPNAQTRKRMSSSKTIVPKRVLYIVIIVKGGFFFFFFLNFPQFCVIKNFAFFPQKINKN